MLTEVEISTAAVCTGNVTLVAPAGTVTLSGTLAAPLLLVSATLAPLVGAGPLKRTVPVDDCNPPTTLVGLRVSEAIVGSNTGLTVSVAVFVVLPKVAEIVTLVDAVTALVVTVNVALVAPAATVTLEGVLATAVLLLARETIAPPAGAAPLNVTVPVEDCIPPVTAVGFSVKAEIVTGGGAAGFTVNDAVFVVPA